MSNASFEQLANRLPPPNYSNSFRAEPLGVTGLGAASMRGAGSHRSNASARGDGMNLGGVSGQSMSRPRAPSSAGRPASAAGRPASAGGSGSFAGSIAGSRHSGLREEPVSDRPDPANFMRKGSGAGSRPSTSSGRGAKADPIKPTAPGSRPSTAPPRRPISRPTSAMPNLRPTRFSMLYERGDLPLAREHDFMSNGVKWKGSPNAFNNEDLVWLLPIFFEGTREPVEVHRFLAARGGLQIAEEAGERGLAPQLVPLVLPSAREALAVRNVQIAGDVLALLSILLQFPGVGKALVGHLRTILTSCLALKSKHGMISDASKKTKKVEFRDVLWSFLELCELKGGEKAYNIIKSCIPDYMRTRKRETALLVEPDTLDQKDGISILKRLGYEVMVTGVLSDALQVAYQQGTLDLLVIDAGAKNEGLLVLNELVRAGFSPKAVALSRNPISLQRDEYLHGGFTAYLSRPFDARRLEAALVAANNL